MSTSEMQRETSLQNLWAIANDLRGNMEANEFKNYILGLIFYRYLAKRLKIEQISLLQEDNISYLEAFEDEEYREGLQEELIEQLGYFIEPKFLFYNINTIYNRRKF